MSFTFAAFPSPGQERTLKEVKVRHRMARKKDIADERIAAFAPGMQAVKIDSVLMQQYAQQSLGRLLEQQVPVFIRSYGINALATLNFRGSSAAQSQLLWNGIPLNNASLGFADISLMQVQQFDKVHILYGGSSALTGSGNVGAALLLDNEFGIEDTLRRFRTMIAARVGSFGQYAFSASERYQGRKWFLSARVSAQQANNDFPYTDPSGNRLKMENAGLSALSGMINAGYKINKYGSLHFSGWVQQSSRRIPPSLFEPFSVKRQDDQALRFFSEWKHVVGGKRTIYSKISFLQDGMQYQDSSIGLRTRNDTRQVYGEAGWKQAFNSRHELMVFLPVNISWMRPERDTQLRAQYKWGIAASYAYTCLRDRAKLAASFRAERINELSVLLPGINASYLLTYWLTLRANVQRSYRAPTLNEWYYQPGGNPLLKPEQGWSQDAGYTVQLPVGKNLLLHHEGSIFNRDIHDWIIWFGGSIWTPHNIARVRSRGIETGSAVLWQKGRWSFRTGVNTAFVRATTRESDIPGDGSIGKQIPYSPRYTAQANVSLGYKSLLFSYNHTYTGYRFVTTDESQYLEPYQAGNLYISCKYFLGKAPAILSFQCNNIWGVRYEVVNLRPMPGRNIAFGCSVTL